MKQYANSTESRQLNPDTRLQHLSGNMEGLEQRAGRWWLVSCIQVPHVLLKRQQPGIDLGQLGTGIHGALWSSRKKVEQEFLLPRRSTDKLRPLLPDRTV
ncbi:hypothetical protein EYF80_000952 [Liparis tanakae]|uniref:Uncharacterized protein n=1 Tax=Liparis tanakae TaxID=230148 RepID=A0A4Z2JEL4_9TELE|nr:hypothetical protein EYF80_000952 [Liparis tanakae]